MLQVTRRALFHIPKAPGGAEARRVARQTFSGSRAGRFTRGTGDHSSSSSGASPSSSHSSRYEHNSARQPRGAHGHRRPPGRTLRPGEPLPPPDFGSSSVDGDSGYTSQRQAYRRRKAEREDADGASGTASVAGSYFTPLPKQYGFYDGLDEHALETPQPTREERREQLRASLEAQAASVVEFTEGGEGDIEMNGLPAEHYHGQAGWTTIPKESALYNTLYGTGDLESRQRTNSWSVAMRHGRTDGASRGGGADVSGGIGELLGESAALRLTTQETNDKTNSQEGAEGVEVLDGNRRRRQHDESLYSTALEGELLAPTQDSVGQPRSTYALRKLFVDGLVGYQGMISRAEEAAVSEELMHLLQSPRAAYIAEEARYCVNLYEKELGIPGKDTLAFALSSCPTLQRVLYRFFFLGLIPAVPNVCQVSEMVGNFSGYPVHRHPRSIGSYVGLLNLVSTSVLHLQHKDSPWYPRLHLTPRSLFVVTEPCLSEYALGYKQTHQPFHTFEYATRVSKDYRIEVLFATVETAQTTTLSQAVQLTEYAAAKMQHGEAGGTSGAPPLLSSSASTDAQPRQCEEETRNGPSEVLFQGNTDEWIEKLRTKLHAAADGDGAKPLDGHELRRQLLARHVVGSRVRGEPGDDDDGAAHDQRYPDAHGAVPHDSARHSTGASSGSAKGVKKASSAAQRRLAALKARFEFAQNLKAAKEQVDVSSSGPRLIRGHSPKDRHMGIK